MKKACGIVFLIVCLHIFLGSFVLEAIDELDNLERSIKDLERSLNQESLAAPQVEQEYPLPKQQVEPFTQGASQLPTQRLQPLMQNMAPADKPATDKAIIKNQERFKKMMEEQQKQISQSMEDWGLVIPKQYRLIVDIFAIAVAITLFGLIFYRRKVREKETEKIVKEEQGPDDDITFYKP